MRPYHIQRNADRADRRENSVSLWVDLDAIQAIGQLNVGISRAVFDLYLVGRIDPLRIEFICDEPEYPRPSPAMSRDTIIDLRNAVVDAHISKRRGTLGEVWEGLNLAWRGQR